jgi:hypothetical protein
MLTVTVPGEKASRPGLPTFLTNPFRARVPALEEVATWPIRELEMTPCRKVRIS